MYYGWILISVMMFGGCFALRDVYRRMRGSGLIISMESTFVGACAGLAVLLIVNGFSFDFTVFTLIMAALSACVDVSFSFFSFKALDFINLSVFSLFSMLGGMILPSAVGILFYHEAVTVAKIVCYLLIAVALLMTVSRGEKKRGTIFYVGVFVLNGMSGVLSKIFTSAPFEKAGAAEYSIWAALFTVALSGSAWLLLTRKRNQSRKPYTWRAFGVSAVSGATNKIANFVLVLALAHVDASVQYPMVTGGVMIVSTLICYFSARKPSKKDVCSVLCAFLGLLALFMIPI